MPRVIGVIDEDTERREQVSALIRAAGGEPVDLASKRREQVSALIRAAGGEPVDLASTPLVVATPVLGHQRDVGNVEADVMVLYGGGTFAVNKSGRYRFPRIVPRAGVLPASTTEDFSVVIRWLICGGPVPTLLAPSNALLAPLVPLGILVDGYVVRAERGHSVETTWFEPAIAAAHRAGQPGGRTVDDAEFWTALETDRRSLENLQRLLDDAGIAPTQLSALVGQARARWPGGAAALAKGMVDTLYNFWNRVTRDPGSIAMAEVEEARVAFGILAAAHF